MVNLGDMAVSNIQQGLNNLPVAAGVINNKRLEDEEQESSSLASPSPLQVRKMKKQIF